jgi:multiple sugar transport system ATP-binding protein
MAEVTTDNLTKVFRSRKDTVTAVNGVSVQIPDGEFAVFVGPSGSGKSTFLRLVAGLEMADGGRICIGDEDVTTRHPRERGIAMVFQDYALYPHMSVAENMSFALQNLHVPRGEIEARVSQAARMLQIEALLHRRPRELSGGQRQRVALGRAIVRQPSVFLFDEPLSNLDAKLRTQMRVELAELHAKLGTTAIYVTHDQVEAMTLGHRIFVMSDGIVQQCGTGEEVYNSPANIFVATFLGTPQINLFDAEVVSNDRALEADIQGQRFALPAARAEAYRPYVGQQVVLGIRPEHLRPSGPGPAEGIGKLEARVRLIEHLGSEALLYLELGEKPLIARLESDVSFASGSALKLGFATDKVHLFDAQTSKAIR